MAYCTNIGPRDSQFICDCCSGKNVQVFCTCMFLVYSIFFIVLVGGITFYLIQKFRGIAGVRLSKQNKSHSIGMEGALFFHGRLKILDSW
jgi:hypothetical protein